MGFSADRFRGCIEALHQTTPKTEDLASCGTCGSQCARRRAGFTPLHMPARRIAEVIVAGGGSRQMDERIRTGSDRLRFQSFPTPMTWHFRTHHGCDVRFQIELIDRKPFIT